jgi:hypothetical protein
MPGIRGDGVVTVSTIFPILVVAVALMPARAEAGSQARANPGSCGDPKEVSFRQDLLPALRESCVSCHYSEKDMLGLDLRAEAAYATVMGRKSKFAGELLVKPGDPDHSFLVEKIVGKPRFGQQMPPYGRPLSPRERKLIVDWTRQGARNN